MKIVSSKQVYRCKLFRVTEDHAVDRTGFEIQRSVVRHNGSAVMMAVDCSKNRVMPAFASTVCPPGRNMWELPAGKVLDDGETSLAAARRELKEETGLKARKWKRLVHFYPSPGFLEESMTIWLAKDLEHGDAEPMDDERIETRWFTKKELRAMIASNRIIDGKTMIGFLHWARTLKSVLGFREKRGRNRRGEIGGRYEDLPPMKIVLFLLCSFLDSLLGGCLLHCCFLYCLLFCSSHRIVTLP